MVAERQEDTPAGAEASATSGAIPTGIDGQMQILLQLVLEQGRQAREDSRATREDLRAMREDSRAMREDSRAMNARIDHLNGRIDRLFYWILGFGTALVIGVVAILIRLLLDS